MSEVRKAARLHPLFVGLPEAEIDRLLGRVREAHYEPGEVIYGSGQPAHSVSVVISGALQIEYPPEGELRGPVTALIVAPAVVGECQVLSERVWSGTGVALTEVSVLGFDRAGWLALLETSPELGRRLYLELAGRFLLAIETWRGQPSLTPPALLARYAAGVAIAYRRVGLDAPALPTNQKDLARATGLTRETINRALRAFEDEGLVRVTRARLEILNEAELVARAGPSFEHFVKTYWALGESPPRK
jgi:CRP-like cAMP-binding protein